MSVNQGEVWIARVPYSDTSDRIENIAKTLSGNSRKKYVLILGDIRPVLILSKDKYHNANSHSFVIVCPLTSRLKKAIEVSKKLKLAGFSNVTQQLLTIAGNIRDQAGLDRNSAIFVLDSDA